MITAHLAKLGYNGELLKIWPIRQIDHVRDTLYIQAESIQDKSLLTDCVLYIRSQGHMTEGRHKYVFYLNTENPHIVDFMNNQAGLHAVYTTSRSQSSEDED